jgi:hypothetical protein
MTKRQRCFAADTNKSRIVCDGGRPNAPHETDAEPEIDPDSDARRDTPVVVNVNETQRIWATGWYRIRPRTFIHYELFFLPDQIACTYAEESYKSYLLRRSGREREAARVGRDYLSRPVNDLLNHTQSFGISIPKITTVELRSGSLLLKPKLVVQVDETVYEFYHWQRHRNVQALAERLREAYTFEVHMR